MSHLEIGYDKRIRESGYRLTPQRQIIMDALCAIGDHATVNEVYERVHYQNAAIDRATVYRTLHFFHGLQLVVSSEIGGETRYEVAGTTPHHHLHCRLCGAEQTVDDQHLANFVQSLDRTYGFTAEIAHLVINGVCRDCRGLEPETTTGDR